MTSDVEPSIELRSPLPPLSEATRASLEAVRRAQEAARERARRETVRARIGVGFLVGAIAIAVVVVGPPVKRKLLAARVASAATSAPKPAAEPTTPAIEVPMAAPAPTPPLPAATAPVAAPSPASSAPAPAAALRAPATTTSATGTPAESACAETFAQHRWQISIDECTRLFESRSGDAALALRIAHAHHAKGHVADAGTWASKAVALDPSLAEGFVLVARAETLAGREDAALDAYRQYLTLAPRGWHSAEARAAVRGTPLKRSHARGAGRLDPSAPFATRQ